MTDFAAAPKVVKPKKKYKEKEPEEQEQDQIKLIYNNLMWDKRVFRGNTYSALVTSKNVQMPHASAVNRTIKLTQNPDLEEADQGSNRRANIQIFTDQYVETLTDKPPRYEYGTQTELKIEKVVVRHQMMKKKGVDRQTQIWDDQFFDFDYEVDPLLSVLVARTLEISRMEILQEEEFTIMRNRQRQLHLEQQMEKKKIQQMYEKQEQLEAQNSKRLEKYRSEKRKKIKTHEKLFSRVLAKQYLKNIKKNTLQYVQGQGFFRNSIEASIIEKVIPQFYSSSLKEQMNLDLCYKQVEQLLNEVKKQIFQQSNKAKENQKERRKNILEKRQQLAREKNERKLMREEEKYMKNFLIEEKLKLEREEQQRRLQEQAAQNADQEAS